MANKRQAKQNKADLPLRFQFLDAAGRPYQKLPHDRILATNETADKVLQNLITACIDQMDFSNCEHGKPKKDDRARAKAKRDYNGDMRYITDYRRAKLSVRSAEVVRDIMEGDTFQKILDQLGIVLVSANNLFENPKDLTGYRCLNMKLAMPVGINEQTKEIEHNIVELQIVADQIEALYDWTHPLKAAAEDYLTTAKDRKLTKVERNYPHILFQACRYYNGIAAREAGYDVLLSEEHRDKHVITPERQASMEKAHKNTLGLCWENPQHPAGLELT